MSHSHQLYCKVKKRVLQWLPDARITRVRNLALLVTGLCVERGIHLSEIVSEWPIPGREPSLVNRLRRFLSNDAVDVARWYRPLARRILSVFAHQQVRLIIDTTKLGFNHRLLMIGLAYRHRTLPLAWSVHEGSRGHTTSAEQLALFRQVATLLPPGADVWVLGDTEFQHVPVLRWFCRHGWHFVMRQQGRIKVYRAGHGWQKLNTFELSPGETRVIGWVRLTEKHNMGWFWLILHWDANEDEPWYLVSDQAGRRRILRMYEKRMWIEEMFGDEKEKGFNLEATHLRDKARLNRLVMGVCIAFVYFITLGSWLVKRGFRPLIDKKHRRDKSYFRLGMDWFRQHTRFKKPLRLHFRPYP
jgi:hypothetical protein